MHSPVATNFTNSKKRVIYKSKRVFFAKAESGKKVYGVKAAFRVKPSGSMVKLTKRVKIPYAIKPAKLKKFKSPGGTNYKSLMSYLAIKRK